MYISVAKRNDLKIRHQNNSKGFDILQRTDKSTKNVDLMPIVKLLNQVLFS